jgi:hypothetical protein
MEPMKPMMMIAAVMAGLSLVATATTFAQDRAKQAEPARRAPARPAQRPAEPARRDARPVQNNDEATRRANAGRTDASRDARTGTDEERRRAAAAKDDRGNGDVTTRRKGLDRARAVHQRNMNLRAAKLARLRAIAAEKGDKDMLSRVERLENQQRQLDERRRKAQQAEEAELSRTERPATREATPPTRGN